MALLLAASATAGANSGVPIAGINQVQNKSYTSDSTIFKLAVPARYKDIHDKYYEGQVFLELYKSNLTPIGTKYITAEYEGSIYFESSDLFENDSPKHVTLAGEDDDMILDLVHTPSLEETALPSVYNMHSCNSTMTACDPMAMQVMIYKSGTTQLYGTFGDDLEVYVDGKWTNKIINVNLLIEKSK
jgi:hypothetical protein